MPRISIVVPAYNEGEHIYKNIKEFEDTFSKLNFDYELVIVDDGSTDNTYEEACRAKSEHVKVLTYSPNHGKGYALKYGVQYTAGELVTFVDADLDLHPKQTSLFIECMSQNGTGIVIGSKRHPQSKVIYPLKRRFLSACYHAFVRLLFGLRVTDTQTGMKLFKREVLLDVLPRVLVKRYAFDLELLAVAHRRGYEITEAPVVLEYRINDSDVDWRAIRDIFIDTCAVFYRMHILKHYDKHKDLNTSSGRTEKAKN